MTSMTSAPQQIRILAFSDVHLSFFFGADASGAILSPLPDTGTAAAAPAAAPAPAPTEATHVPFAPLASAPNRYRKYDAQGNELPADAANPTTVRDLATGLEWLIPYVEDRQMTADESGPACAALRVGGHSDWRVPQRFESESMLDLSRHSPAVDTSVFPGTKSEWHWTASADASDEAYAWGVDFHYGYAVLLHRGGRAWVRAVRSFAPASQ